MWLILYLYIYIYIYILYVTHSIYYIYIYCMWLYYTCASRVFSLAEDTDETDEVEPLRCLDLAAARWLRWLPFRVSEEVEERLVIEALLPPPPPHISSRSISFSRRIRFGGSNPTFAPRRANSSRHNTTERGSLCNTETANIEGFGLCGWGGGPALFYGAVCPVRFTFFSLRWLV